MLVKIEFSMTAPQYQVIDLEDYGHSSFVKWENLTEEEQQEITDNIAEEYCVIAGGEDINE